MPKIEKLKSGKYRMRIYSHWVYQYDKNGCMIYDNSGKPKKKDVYKSITADSVRELKKKAARFELQKDADNNMKSREDITLKQACERYIESRSDILSPSTKSSYESISRNRLKLIMNRNINDITQEDIQKAVNEDAKEVSPKITSRIGGPYCTTNFCVVIIIFSNRSNCFGCTNSNITPIKPTLSPENTVNNSKHATCATK